MVQPVRSVAWRGSPRHERPALTRKSGRIGLLISCFMVATRVANPITSFYTRPSRWIAFGRSLNWLLFGRSCSHRITLRGGLLHRGHFNFFAVAAGFVFQTAFLYIRGHAIVDVPSRICLKYLFFSAWSVALIYLVIGPAYRLSLMGGIYCAVDFSDSIFCASRADRSTASIQRARESVAGNACLDFDCRSRHVRPRLHRRRYVSGAGTPTQDAPTPFDLLSSSTFNRFVRRHHAITMDGFRSLHGRARQRVFYRAAFAAGKNDLGNRSLDFLRGDFAGPSLAAPRPQARGSTLRHCL